MADRKIYEIASEVGRRIIDVIMAEGGTEDDARRLLNEDELAIQIAQLLIRQRATKPPVDVPYFTSISDEEAVTRLIPKYGPGGARVVVEAWRKLAIAHHFEGDPIT